MTNDLGRMLVAMILAPLFGTLALLLFLLWLYVSKVRW
jgi:hypothetical protein